LQTAILGPLNFVEVRAVTSDYESAALPLSYAGGIVNAFDFTAFPRNGKKRILQNLAKIMKVMSRFPAPSIAFFPGEKCTQA